MPLTALQACIAERVPYIDVADDRDFVRRAYEFAESEATPNGIVALIGCSVVPGLTSLLTRFGASNDPANRPNEDMYFAGYAKPAGEEHRSETWCVFAMVANGSPLCLRQSLRTGSCAEK
jgi:hypothetical protein